MGNVINEILGSLPKEQNIGQGLEIAQKSFDSATANLVGITQQIQERVKNEAINEILSMDPIKDPQAYQNALSDRLTHIDGIDPVMALNLARAKTAPAFAERDREDKLLQQDITNAYKDANLGLEYTKQEDLTQYRADTIEQNDKNSQRSYDKGKFTTFDDDNGSVWRLDKNTGTAVNIKDASGVPNKYIGVKTMKKSDGFGGYVKTEQRVDTRTGKPLGEAYVVEKVSAPLTQKDKDFLKSYGSSSIVSDRILNSINTNPGAWGGIDEYTGKIGNFFGSEEGQAQSLAKQDLNEMTLSITGKLSGVLSDRDMQTLLDTIPQISNQPELARKKLIKANRLIGNGEAAELNRLLSSNPAVVKDIVGRITNGEVKAPYGYKLQRNKSTGEYRFIKAGN